MDFSDRGSVIVVKCSGHVCYCVRGGRLCLAVRSEFSSVGVVVLVVMRGSAHTHTHTNAVMFIFTSGSAWEWMC